MNCFVAQIDLALAEKLKEGLLAQGFELSVPAYTLFQGKKKGLSCTLYQSGKLTVQGKDKAAFIEFYLEPEILKSFTFGYTTQSLIEEAHQGVDESGKGDFFGPLCVAGVFATEKQIAALTQMGVKDSKQLTDKTIRLIAPRIRKEYLFHLVIIEPKKYNELYAQFGNLNLLLAWGHATVIAQLVEKSGCLKCIIDRFGADHLVEAAVKKKQIAVELTQRTRAEEDPVVAAASILARAAFLEGLERLENQMGVALPKGAGPQTIQAGIRLVQKQGEESLTYVAKTHFKTTQEILSHF